MTSKRLLLLRHAKSTWADGLRDFDRPLNARGLEAARRLGLHLKSQGGAPDLILCSPARRTRETLDRLSAITGWTTPILHEDRLYAANVPHLLERLVMLEGRHGSVLLVGHNPALAELALLLGRRGPIDLRQRLAERYPTGGLAEIDFGAVRWRDIASADGRLISFVTPRRLPKAS